MRANRRSLAIATSMILSATASTADVRADEPAAAARRITVVASPAILPPGARCRVEMLPEAVGSTTTETTFEGKVVTADDEGLTLAVSSTFRRDVFNAEAARLPLIGRLFTNIGISRTEKDVRIAAEKIRSVELMQD